MHQVPGLRVKGRSKFGRKEGREVEKKNEKEGFPGGTVVKNPPANARDMGSSPGRERSHMPRSN